MKLFVTARKHLHRRLGLALACTLAALPAGARSYTPPDVRAAQLAAHQALAERVLALDVGGETTVRQLVGRSDRVAAGLNRFVKQAAMGTPFTHGHRLAVETAVSRAALARTLTELGVANPGHAARLRSGGPDRIAAVGVANRHPDHVLAVHPRPVTPVALPRIIEPPAPPTPSPTAAPPRPPNGAFRRYANDPVMPTSAPDPAARLRARRAAEVNALRRLAERGGAVQVETHSATDGGVLTTDATHVYTSATLPGVRFGPARGGTDGTVQVDATLGSVSNPVTVTGTAVVPSEAHP